MISVALLVIGRDAVVLCSEGPKVVPEGMREEVLGRYGVRRRVLGRLRCRGDQIGGKNGTYYEML